jgi:hypothetical protein
MRRTLLFASTVLFALSTTSPASATKPIREVHPGQPDIVITGQCAFPVLAHIEGREIVTTFLDAGGAPVKQIVAFPGNKITLTNGESGTSIVIMGTGSSQLRAEPDGSTSAKSTGHGPFFPNPLTGEPGIWYLSGQGRATIDASGNLTSVELSGQLVDVCPDLAS